MLEGKWSLEVGDYVAYNRNMICGFCLHNDILIVEVFVLIVARYYTILEGIIAPHSVTIQYKNVDCFT